MQLVFIKKKSTIKAWVKSKERKEPGYKSTSGPPMAHIAERGYPRTSKAQGKSKVWGSELLYLAFPPGRQT